MDTSHAQYEFHPIANIFPLMDGDEYKYFKDDILECGLEDPIWLYEGKILDGRNRYRACADTETDLKFQEYSGSSPVQFVLSRNLHRRHLDATKRSMVAARIQNLPEGRPTKTGPIGPVSISDSAGLLNVGLTSVKRALKVLRDGSNALINATDAGQVSVYAASEFSDLPKDTQEQALFHALTEATGGKITSAQLKKAVKAATSNPHVSNNSGENEWYTPTRYLDLARAVMGGIDLDPASSDIANKVVQASRHYTEDDDGLSQKWAGRIWMNPPYARGLVDKFSSTLVSKYENFEFSQATVLVNNATDTKWFHKLASCADAICFTDHRVKFLTPEGSKGAPLQGQAIFYFCHKKPEQIKKFWESFREVGLVMISYRVKDARENTKPGTGQAT